MPTSKRIPDVFLMCPLKHPVDVSPTLKVSQSQDKAKLTDTSVVAFWVPHTKVSHGAGGKAHAYLTDVTALQVHEELGLTFNAAVILGASLTAFGARWWPLSTNCGNTR